MGKFINDIFITLIRQNINGDIHLMFIDMKAKSNNNVNIHLMFIDMKANSNNKYKCKLIFVASTSFLTFLLTDIFVGHPKVDIFILSKA